MAEKPVGVAVLAVLSLVLGILLILGAVVVAVVSTLIIEFIRMSGTTLIWGSFDVSGFIQAFLIAIALIAAVFGILYIFAAYGMWIGAGWGWVLAIVLAILNFVWGLFTLPNGIVWIVINAIVLWYLIQPHVKAFFRKAPPLAPPPPPPL